MKKKSFLLDFLLYFFTGMVVVIGNLFTVMIASLMRNHIRSIHEHQKLLSIFSQIESFTLSFAFAIPSIMIIIYFLPLLIKNKDDITFKKRILNAPITASFIGFTGWLLSTVIFFIHVFVHKIDIDTVLAIRFIIENTILGLICFIIGYLILEVFYRWKVIPYYFSDNRLSHFKGILTPNITQKFFIYLIAVTIIPTAIFIMFIIAYFSDNNDFSRFTPLLFLTFITIFDGITLTLLASLPYKNALNEMIKHTEMIANGNLENTIRVRSTDELGKLSEAMNEMTQGLLERDKIKETFGKMVDPKIRDHLLNNKIELGGKVCRGTILFCDIRNFTSITESIPPEKVVYWLNTYFEKVSEQIFTFKGIVNKYIGDAVMALFGIPIESPDASYQAVMSAIAILHEVERLNVKFRSENLPEIEIGIGIHEGELLAGNIGSSTRMEYTVIGDSVNIASRIESQCKTLNSNLIVSENVIKNIRDNKIKFQSLGNIHLKGRNAPVSLYEIITK